MNLKIKILLLAILPLLFAAAVLSFLGLNHARDLADQALEVYENNLLVARQQALKEQMNLADSAIAHIRADPALSEADAQAQVKDLLNNISFGENGYFFAYTVNGASIVHPMIPEFVGTNLYDFQDREGNCLIRHLIEAAAR